MAREIIRLVLEFSAIILVLVGLYYEKELIKFENKLIRAVCIRMLRAYNRSKEKQAAQARKIQPRSPALDAEAETRPELRVVRKGKRDTRVA